MRKEVISCDICGIVILGDFGYIELFGQIEGCDNFKLKYDEICHDCIGKIFECMQLIVKEDK
jgi:hypothetical protein